MITAIFNWWKWVWTEPTELTADDDLPVIYSVYQSTSSGYDYIAKVTVLDDEREIYAYGNEFTPLESWALDVWNKLLDDPYTDEVFSL